MNTLPFLPLPLVRALRTAAPGWIRLALQTARLMVGVSDYQSYVRYRQTFHPGEPVPSYADFFRQRQDAFYAFEKGSVRGIC